MTVQKLIQIAAADISLGMDADIWRLNSNLLDTTFKNSIFVSLISCSTDVQYLSFVDIYVATDNRLIGAGDNQVFDRASEGLLFK